MGFVPRLVPKLATTNKKSHCWCTIRRPIQLVVVGGLFHAGDVVGGAAQGEVLRTIHFPLFHFLVKNVFPKKKKKIIHKGCNELKIQVHGMSLKSPLFFFTYLSNTLILFLR